MKFENHLIDEKERDFLGIPKDGVSSALDDYRESGDSEEDKAIKDLNFFIRKPFCGCGRCSL